MEHLNVFVEWEAKKICQLKSGKQYFFFLNRLNNAVSVHPYKVEKAWTNCYGFYNEAGELYLSVELKKEGRNGTLSVDIITPLK